jgi:hypothetical protein
MMWLFHPSSRRSATAGRAQLSFERDKDLREVVRNFIADDLDEQMKLVTLA